jgi:hypothetical protein
MRNATRQRSRRCSRRSMQPPAGLQELGTGSRRGHIWGHTIMRRLRKRCSVNGFGPSCESPASQPDVPRRPGGDPGNTRLPRQVPASRGLFGNEKRLVLRMHFHVSLALARKACDAAKAWLEAGRDPLAVGGDRRRAAHRARSAVRVGRAAGPRAALGSRVHRASGHGQDSTADARRTNDARSIRRPRASPPAPERATAIRPRTAIMPMWSRPAAPGRQLNRSPAASCAPTGSCG